MTDGDEQIEADLRAVENELRADGRLSSATCEALRVDRRFAGLESCLRFLWCTVFAPDPDGPPVPRRRRVQACRLMLVALRAHTSTPRWTRLQIEQLVEAALAVPGAELSDLAQAQFALLGETAEPSVAQQRFLREVAQEIAYKRRLGHRADDFIYIAVRLADPMLPPTRAQIFFAKQIAPPRQWS